MTWRTKQVISPPPVQLTGYWGSLALPRAFCDWSAEVIKSAPVVITELPVVAFLLQVHDTAEGAETRVVPAVFDNEYFSGELVPAEDFHDHKYANKPEPIGLFPSGEPLAEAELSTIERVVRGKCTYALVNHLFEDLRREPGPIGGYAHRLRILGEHAKSRDELVELHALACMINCWSDSLRGVFTQRNQELEQAAAS